jgi:hypothetical protein
LEWNQYEYCLESALAPTGAYTLANFQTTTGWRGSTLTTAGVYQGPGAKMKATDVAPPPGLNYYLIVIAKTDSCIASSVVKDQTETYNTSVSNMEEYSIIGVAENQNNLNGLEIYPNPANDKLTIETTQKSEIEILNIQGQLIKSITSNGKTTIDISELAPGMYFVKVKTENGIAVKKFVKE